MYDNKAPPWVYLILLLLLIVILLIGAELYEAIGTLT